MRLANAKADASPPDQTMLRDEILATLSYYDVHDMPLTAGEVFRFLVKKEAGSFPSADQVQVELHKLEYEGIVGARDKQYFLFGREYIIPLRREHERLAQRKWCKAIRAVRWLVLVPYIRTVFISGSLSMNNTDELADADVIIIARHGRIWLTRMLTAGVLSLLGARRRHGEQHAPDKICPNHFITDESLNIPFQSMYTAQLYANVVPVIVDDSGLLKSFQMQNEWVFHYLHHWQMPEDRISPRGLASWICRIGEALINIAGNWFEARARSYQKRLIVEHSSLLIPGGHLTFTDEALAFHAQSSASEILAKYENSQSKLALGLY